MTKTSLPSAAWDLTSFLSNATSYMKTAGGALLILIGVAGLIWGAVLFLKKLMSPAQGQSDSWGKIIGLVLVGGAIATGGFQLISTIGGGGEKTIRDLGGGVINLAPYLVNIPGF